MLALVNFCTQFLVVLCRLDELLHTWACHFARNPWSTWAKDGNPGITMLPTCFSSTSENLFWFQLQALLQRHLDMELFNSRSTRCPLAKIRHFDSASQILATTDLVWHVWNLSLMLLMVPDCRAIVSPEHALVLMFCCLCTSMSTVTAPKSHGTLWECPKTSTIQQNNYITG